jgi:hypothetical protein
MKAEKKRVKAYTVPALHFHDLENERIHVKREIKQE